MRQANSASSKAKILVRVEAYLEAILPNFLIRRRGDIEVMREARERGDYEALRVFGHRMKGTGGAYGLDAITDLGESLEQAAREENGAALQGILNYLEDYLNRVEVVYQ